MSNPWELTRIFPGEYSDWQEEAHNGETLLGFDEWIHVLHPSNFPPSEPAVKLSDLRMPMEVITRADLIIGGGRVLKNRHGATGGPYEAAPADIALAFREGECIWDSRVDPSKRATT